MLMCSKIETPFLVPTKLELLTLGECPFGTLKRWRSNIKMYLAKIG